jgi:soluble lytic murein transglycosylase-like protein
MPRPIATALLLAAVAAMAAPAAADYVVFRDGRALKVRAWRFEGADTVVELSAGGEMRFTSRVVRYVAPDEDVEVAPAALAAAAAAAAAADGERSWLAWADPRYIDAIRAASAEHAVSPALVAAVIRVESDFRAHAVSPKGAQGLMQLMPATARELGLADPFEPEGNIRAGVAHLGGLLERYRGDVQLALAAYNAGARAVDRSGGIPPYAETRRYVARVLDLVRRAGD